MDFQTRPGQGLSSQTDINYEQDKDNKLNPSFSEGYNYSFMAWIQ